MKSILKNKVCLSADVLKLMAIISMTIDHVGVAFFPEATWLRYIGRLAFPVFCFQLTEGFAHTSNLKKYSGRLALFAVLSEVPHGLLAGSFVSKNVLFELLCGLLCLVCLTKINETYERKYKKTAPEIFIFDGLVVLAFCFIASLVSFEYGFYGVLTIAFFYVFRKKRWLGATLFAALNIVMAVVDKSLLQPVSIFALIPICLYDTNKKPNKHYKYITYIYYPAHMLLLWGISVLIN